MLTFKHTLLVNGLHSTLNLWAGYYFIWRIVLVTLHCGKKKKVSIVAIRRESVDAIYLNELHIILRFCLQY